MQGIASPAPQRQGGPRIIAIRRVGHSGSAVAVEARQITWSPSRSSSEYSPPPSEHHPASPQRSSSSSSAPARTTQSPSTPSRSTGNSSSSSGSSYSSSSDSAATAAGNVFSGASQHSQAASSRFAGSGGGGGSSDSIGRGPMHRSPAGASACPRDGAAATAGPHVGSSGGGGRFAQNHRSTLVSTIDVEVAMAKRMARRQQNGRYLQARWSHMHRAAEGKDAVYRAAVAAGVTLDPTALPVNVDRDDFFEVKRRTDALYTRNMDSLVELYLSATPLYREALGKFRSHLPRDEQRLRTADSLDAYRRASRSDSGGDTHRRHRSPAGVGGGDPMTAGHGSADGRDWPWWQLAKADIELLGTDAARRARFGDDTLPWRPTDFNATDIQLEPLYGEEGAPVSFTSAIGNNNDRLFSSGGSGGGGGLPAQHAEGGSLNLLMEVLILTEPNTPYTFGVPAMNFTNTFVFLASYFALPDVLVAKFIRFFRSVRVWGAVAGASEDPARPAALMRRVLHCLGAYCRTHEMDLTLPVVQRLAYFVESAGFHNPLGSFFPETAVATVQPRGTFPAMHYPHHHHHYQLGTRRSFADEWPCSEGVYDVRRTAHAARQQQRRHPPRSPARSGDGIGSSSSGEGGGGGSPAQSFFPANDAVSHLYSPLYRDAHATPWPGTGQRWGPPLLNPDVASSFVELALFVRRFFEKHYRRLATLPVGAATDLPLSGRPSHHFSPWGGDGAGSSSSGGGNGSEGLPSRTAAPSALRMSLRSAPASPPPPPQPPADGYTCIDTGRPRHQLGTMYASARDGVAGMMGGDPSLTSSPAWGDDSNGSNSMNKDTTVRRDASLTAGGQPRRYYYSKAAATATRDGGGGNDDDNDSDSDSDTTGPRAGGSTNGDRRPHTAGGPERRVPRPHPSAAGLLQPTEIDADTFAEQLCLLSFSLFSAIHIRELLHNAWTDPGMRRCVSFHLHEFMEFTARLQRWTAAAIVTAAPDVTLAQRRMRHMLEVTRRLYETQNYQAASAVLGGLRHPAVAAMEEAHAAMSGSGDGTTALLLLSAGEQRELATLRELLDPFASYSPSSLNSVTARAAGEMEQAMIPLLGPILGVLYRTEDGRGHTVTIRATDGQAAVNWTKIVAVAKILSLWLRCQYTPYKAAVDPPLQEYLWSIRFHQWTDATLLRVAKRQ